MQVPNHHRRCQLNLIPRREGLKSLSLIIYGRSAAELSVVPCEEIQSIARRYPDYHSSLFFLADVAEVLSERKHYRTYSRESR